MDAPATTRRITGWVTGVVSLHIPSMSSEELEAVQRATRLYRRVMGGGHYVEFSHAEGDWLHVPRGWFYGPGQELPFLVLSSLQEGRSNGKALPEGTGVRGATFGMPPHPAGQPQFIADLIHGARLTGVGGLAVAPTRSGKTLCSLEAASQLGRATLILVDRKALAAQWHDEVVKWVKDGHGRPVRCGYIWGDRFDLPPEYPFVVGMIQTLARRPLPDEVRRAFGTIILDEADCAPTNQSQAAIQRFAAHYLLGLTATPDRKDGLGPAIEWITGARIGELKRDLKADVHFLRIPFRKTKVPTKDGTGERPPRVKRPGGGTDIIDTEKSLMRDTARVELIAQEVLRACENGRQVLLLVGLRDHAKAMLDATKALGLDPGLYIGGATDKERFKHNPVIATFGAISKGVDVQPPPTLCILAAPRADVRQAIGRALQPQAPHKPFMLDVVDEHPRLIKMARSREKQYRDLRLDLRNQVDG